MNVEKAKGLVRKSYEAMKGSNCLEEQWLKEALQALDEPCKTCGGTKRVPTKQSIGFGEQNQIIQECPDCQEPPASEFVKKAKDYLIKLVKKITEGADDKWGYKGLTVFLWQACDLLDSQQQRIEERDKIIATQDEDITALRNDLFELNDRCVRIRRGLESQLDKKQQRIKELEK